MNPHFALKDLESAWQWIGRPPITEADVTAVSRARCNHGPAIASMKQALERLTVLEARCIAHAAIEASAQQGAADRMQPDRRRVA